MAAIPAADAGLEDLERWSDLTLVCGGEQFKVHKVYVCSRSPVLSAAWDGQFAVSVLPASHLHSRTMAHCLIGSAYRDHPD